MAAPRVGVIGFAIAHFPVSLGRRPTALLVLRRWSLASGIIVPAHTHSLETMLDFKETSSSLVSQNIQQRLNTQEAPLFNHRNIFALSSKYAILPSERSFKRRIYC